MFSLTSAGSGGIITSILIHQTDEAEIKAMMPAQRACDAVNQAGNTLSNGPRRVQSNACFNMQSILQRLQAGVICRGYACIL